VRCSFPNLWRVFDGLPLIPSRPIARRHKALRGTLNRAKKALAEIGLSYNMANGFLLDLSRC
jgi:hypothetical protein